MPTSSSSSARAFGAHRNGLPSSSRRVRPDRSVNGGSTGSKKKVPLDLAVKVLFCVGMISASFYAGALAGMQSAKSAAERECLDATRAKREEVEETIKERVRQGVAMTRRADTGTEVKAQDDRTSGGGGSGRPRFTRAMSSFAVGMARTRKDDFISEFDYGIPAEHKPNGKSDEVLLIYSTDGAIPSTTGTIDEDVAEAIVSDGLEVPLLGALDATSNCDSLNIISTRPPSGSSGGPMRQCIAMVGSYESNHVHRWMRSAEEDSNQGGSTERKTTLRARVPSSLPLRHVGRGMQSNGVNQFFPPDERSIAKNWDMLRNYLNSVDGVLRQLSPIARAAALESKDGRTVVVMVCNMGQSTLLSNFACSSRARGLDLGNVLVFATDTETLGIAEALGLKAFYSEQLFGSLPAEEAKRYGDPVFTAMMYSKVVTVQLINMLGYDLLFQDVDVVWYKDPITFFNDESSPFYHFDILFQDDGARTVRYAPYSANSGFYYVRNNDRTRYFFTALLYSGDMVIMTNSHQQALTALLAEHSSLYGLNVKTLSGDDFPGGFHFNRRRDYMRELAQGKKIPCVFHMSWTLNKDDKLRFLKQMGMWYVNDKCTDEKALGVLRDRKARDARDVSTHFSAACCSSEPLLSCHYRDKPSVMDCNHSPNIDKKGQPFWPATI